MIGASAEVAILKLFCIFNNFVSFSRRKYPAKHNILPPTLENSRYIFSNFFSIFWGIQHKFWSGDITISIMSVYIFISKAGSYLVLLQLENRCIYFEFKLS